MKKLILFLLSILLLSTVVHALDISNMRLVMNQYSGSPDWIRGTNQTGEEFIFENLSITNLEATNLESNLDGTGYNITASWFKGYLNWSDVQNKFITAVDNIYIYMSGTTAMFNETKLNSSIDARSGLLNVNSSDYWDSLNTPSDINAADITDDNTYALVAGETFTGNVIVPNITAIKYFKGQPLDGTIGSGVIYSETTTSKGEVNITDEGGLSVTYPNVVMRLVTSANVVTYCNITGATITIPDDQHTVFYVNSACNVLNTTMSNYLATDLSPGGLTDIFNVYAVDGDIETLKGITVKNKETIKARKEHFYTDHLKIVSGMNIDTTTTFPEGFMNSGEYLFIRTIVDATEQNSTADGIHIVYHNGASDWIHSNQTGVNLTHCDNGTTAISCASDKYRRYIIYVIGFNDGEDHTQLHELLPRTADTAYTNLGDCMDIVASPISFTLPSSESYTAVPIYAYCGARDDTDWVNGWIDLRTGGIGYGASPDTSIFLTLDGTRPMEGSLDLDDNDIIDVDDIGSTSDEIDDVFIGTNQYIYLGDGQESYLSYNGSALIIKVN